MGNSPPSRRPPSAKRIERLGGKDARFDAIILDVSLPDGDGRDFCVKLRRQGHKMPVIMLTGSDAETDVVRGLDSGANDYIAKPFRLNELLARLRAQLRIFENSEDAVFTIGPYTFRPSAKLLQEPTKNRRIRLTEKEAAILKFLYRAGDRAVARQVLLERGLGLQRRRHHPHAGNPHLPAAPKDRTRSGQCPAAGDGGRRLPAGPGGCSCYCGGVTKRVDDLYWQDILVWSERQAELLRRVAGGERVNDVDWDHVIEEIEDVGSSELHSVQSLLRHGMVHLLKIVAWPDAQPVEHWRSEVPGFLADANMRFAPSMRQ